MGEHWRPHLRARQLAPLISPSKAHQWIPNEALLEGIVSPNGLKDIHPAPEATQSPCVFAKMLLAVNAVWHHTVEFPLSDLGPRSVSHIYYQTVRCGYHVQRFRLGKKRLRLRKRSKSRFLKAWCCTAIASLLRLTLTIRNTKSSNINIQQRAASHMLCFYARHNIKADLQRFCFLTRRDRDPRVMRTTQSQDRRTDGGGWVAKLDPRP